jgi:hypothetical protein
LSPSTQLSLCYFCRRSFVVDHAVFCCQQSLSMPHARCLSKRPGCSLHSDCCSGGLTEACRLGIGRKSRSPSVGRSLRVPERCDCSSVNPRSKRSLSKPIGHNTTRHGSCLPTVYSKRSLRGPSAFGDVGLFASHRNIAGCGLSLPLLLSPVRDCADGWSILPFPS